MTHLLDTSAILAHLLDEPGADQVSSVLAGGREVAALTRIFHTPTLSEMGAYRKVFWSSDLRTERVLNAL